MLETRPPLVSATRTGTVSYNAAAAVAQASSTTRHEPVALPVPPTHALCDQGARIQPMQLRYRVADAKLERGEPLLSSHPDRGNLNRRRRRTTRLSARHAAQGHEVHSDAKRAPRGRYVRRRAVDQVARRWGSQGLDRTAVVRVVRDPIVTEPLELGRSLHQTRTRSDRLSSGQQRDTDEDRNAVAPEPHTAS